MVVLVLGTVGAYFALGSMSYRTGIKDILSSHAIAKKPAMTFEIADTDAKRSLGLGNRAVIEDNYGMLFVFDTPQRYGFWMKDMLVPIDITWLSDNGTVILIDHSVNPDTYPDIFYPPVSVKYVLETRAGYAADHAWDVGTKINLPAPYGS